MQINFGRFSKAQIQVSLAGTIVMLFAIAFSSCERVQKPLMTADTHDASQTTALSPDATRASLTILGGTPGGSFLPFATAVRDIATQHEPQLEIGFETSPGSVENTRRVNENPAYLGVAFASESHLGYHGQEIFAEEGAKTNIRAVTLLYIAYAQTAVFANSDIHQFEDLIGKKIANGGMGSGSAQTMERWAKSVGIWDQIIPIYKSSNEGAAALQSGEADAFQMLVSVPNEAMAQLAATNEIRMLDMDRARTGIRVLRTVSLLSIRHIARGSIRGQNRTREHAVNANAAHRSQRHTRRNRLCNPTTCLHPRRDTSDAGCYRGRSSRYNNS